MNNIFDILPDSFFNIFNGNNKRIISDCLYLVYDSFKNDLSFSISKEDILMIFQDYFDSHITEVESEDFLITSRDKSLYVLKRLRECGWVSEDVEENYEVVITFEDYAIKILDALFTLNIESDAAYSGNIYNIYISFETFDLNHGDLVFETAYENTKELATRLKNLNSSIKKYIQRLLDEGIKDDLELLLTSLLEDYQSKIVDRAYYNLTTYDNPSKYRNKIINNIENIINNHDYVEYIISLIMDKKKIDYNSASELLYNQSDYIIDSFEHIEDIMQEIDNKNTRFVGSAINRIKFLLNNKKDIVGKINNIIKGISNGIEVNDLGNIYLNQFTSVDSLYTPRVFNKTISSEIEDNIILDENKRNQVINQIKKSEQYSHKYITKMVMQLLKNGPFLGSSLPLDSNDDLITLVLIYLYGYTYGSKYVVEPLDKEVIKNNYRFIDFKVKEKK